LLSQLTDSVKILLELKKSKSSEWYEDKQLEFLIHNAELVIVDLKQLPKYHLKIGK
jgi:hypothetical protein